MYLVVGILIDICFLRLSYPFVSDRQPLVVVQYRYDFYFILPVVYNALYSLLLDSSQNIDLGKHSAYSVSPLSRSL